MAIWFLLSLCLITLGAVFIGKSRAKNLVVRPIAAQDRPISTRPSKPDTLKLHSRPIYHGTSLAIISAGPALIVTLIWAIFSNRIIDQLVLVQFSEELVQFTKPQIQAFVRDSRAIAFGGFASFTDPLKQAAAISFAKYQALANGILVAGCMMLVVAGFFIGLKYIKIQYRARHLVETTVKIMLLFSAAVAVFATIGIVFSLLIETLEFFAKISIFDFLFGMHWSPQSAFEGAGSASSLADNSLVFGAVPLFAGTLLITLIAMAVAAPIGLMAAIYLSDYSSATFRAYAKPLLEILAGIPTVVYGFFAALTVAPAIRGWGEFAGLSVSSESALAAGLVMGIMIIPFVSSLSDDVINAVPQSLRDGSLALGATRSETIRRVVIPAALPGIVSALLLAISRAVGETMIVVMAAGLAANLTINPLEAVTTVTVQIVTLLVGDQEFDSAKTLAAFALGLVLFCITLVLNIIALRVVQKYREQYD